MSVMCIREISPLAENVKTGVLFIGYRPPRSLYQSITLSLHAVRNHRVKKEESPSKHKMNVPMRPL